VSGGGGWSFGEGGGVVRGGFGVFLNGNGEWYGLLRCLFLPCNAMRAVYNAGYSKRIS